MQRNIESYKRKAHHEWTENNAYRTALNIRTRWQSITEYLKEQLSDLLIFNVYQRFPRKIEKGEDVLQFADDTCIICHSKSDENLLCKNNGVFENTERYMRQNILTFYPDKTEIVVFSKNGESKIEQFHHNRIFIEPKTNCRYLGIMIKNNPTFDIQLNKTLTKWQKLLVNLRSKTFSTTKSTNRSF